jgi:outer membrane protein TolC
LSVGLFAGTAGVAAPADDLGSMHPPGTAATFPTQPLSLAETLDIALRRNPAILKAQKDLEAAQGIAVQTRAIVVPKVRITGNYSAVQPSDVDSPPVLIPGFHFGTDQAWHAQIRLVQSLYEGGRMVSAIRAARLVRERGVLDCQTAIANALLAVEIAYYDVLLAVQQIAVEEASIELLSQELADTKRRFDAGTVPRFNVLRAEVELANGQPRLIRARNSLRLSRNHLANLLGVNVPRETLQDIPLTLSGKLEAEPLSMDLPRSIALALERRTELGSLRRAESLRREEIVNAKAGYKPSLQAFAGYDAHSSLFGPNLTDEVHGWITGVEVTWDVFDGLRTRGRVAEAKAAHERVVIELAEAERGIELEVRTAYSRFVEAQEVLASQEKVMEQAEEALRLARARSEAGAGTQLDVLSAQTALTQARTIQAQALRDYAVTRAQLNRAIGAMIPRVDG